MKRRAVFVAAAFLTAVGSAQEPPASLPAQAPRSGVVEAPEVSVYKDPFEELLPKEATPEAAARSGSKQDLGPPPVIIEGVLWGTDKPRVIIDGEVYAVGDRLQTVDAEVFKIKENIVFISYGERIYEMNVKTKGVP